MSEWWQQTNEPEENKHTDGEAPRAEEPAATPETPTEPAASPAEPDRGGQPTEPSAAQPQWQQQQPQPLYRPTPPTYSWNAQQPTYTPPTWQAPQNPQNNHPQPPRKNGVLIALVAVLGALCILCVGVTTVLLVNRSSTLWPSSSVSQGTESSPSSSKTSPSGAVNGPTVNIQSGDVSDGGLSTAEIVARNLDATVMINTYDRNTRGNYGDVTLDGEGEKLASQASGIIWREDGYIITNHHVCVDSTTNQMHSRIEVQLYNGALYDATVIGLDSDTDLAVLKIDATGLKTVEFGDSDKVSLGDRVITIGNSGGMSWSVSEGILSGRSRDIYDRTGYSIQCFQVDATINPGNSGGPLFNIYGQVIGINSAKIVYEGYENLGFSIPIQGAKPVLDDLVKYGYVTGRIELGITGYDVSQEGYQGFMIESISETSSLAGQGLQRYDIITHVDGVRVQSRTELRRELSQHKAGDTVELTLMRITNNRTGATTDMKITVTLKETQGDMS